jgi:hypothetical protein
MEQVYDPSDDLLSPPTTLFLDAFDPSLSGNNKFRTLPASLDLSPSTSNLDLTGFGVVLMEKIHLAEPSRSGNSM